ncbi:MAG: diphosphomevalonate/mevalonate 3,5-bisphosphate decarboxylase family protein [Anaerolineales bacterium]
MKTRVPEGFIDSVERMRAAHESILEALRRRGMTIPDYTDYAGRGRAEGTGAAKAYPIQGILKYHGMADWRWRTAYLPSISVNNDAAYTITLVTFDPALAQDDIRINGRLATDRAQERVLRVLDELRRIGGITSPARVISRNFMGAATTAKGLGTSASASAALAAAAARAAFPDIPVHGRFINCLARLLAGSGCRSAAGGIALWLSYPGIAHEESFALRLDRDDQLRDVRLITLPLSSRIGLQTERAHREAPQSPLFRPWMYSRHEEVLECIEAVQQNDWETVGQLAELDSIRLHAVTMSASRENKIFAWEPENIILFRACNDMRREGIPVYFSTDTGPTTVFITHEDHVKAVRARLRALKLGVEPVVGKISGPVQMLSTEEAKIALGIC